MLASNNAADGCCGQAQHTSATCLDGRGRPAGGTVQVGTLSLAAFSLTAPSARVPAASAIRPRPSSLWGTHMAAGIPEDPVAEIHELKRTLGPLHLIALGIGAIIGAGIFVLTGHAAASYAGPGVVISFAIAGAGCLFAGLCYAEFASMIPVAGSAYTYTYATLGRFLAWIIGWNLVLEYLAASSTVAVGWSGYFSDLLKHLGVAIPVAF